MNDNTKKKVFLIYYKKNEKERELYAWTIEKEALKKFLNQRNRYKYEVVKKKLNPHEFKKFVDMYEFKRIIPDLLFDGEDDISIMMTIEEMDKLLQKSEEISDRINKMEYMLTTCNIEFYKDLDSYPMYLTDDVKKLLLGLIKASTRSAKGGCVLNVNSLKIFYSLFKEYL